MSCVLDGITQAFSLFSHVWFILRGRADLYQLAALCPFPSLAGGSTTPSLI